jgi:hypothetical protein
VIRHYICCHLDDMDHIHRHGNVLRDCLCDRDVPSLGYVSSGGVPARKVFPREGIRGPYQMSDGPLPKSVTPINFCT